MVLYTLLLDISQLFLADNNACCLQWSRSCVGSVFFNESTLFFVVDSIMHCERACCWLIVMRLPRSARDGLCKCVLPFLCQNFFKNVEDEYPCLFWVVKLRVLYYLFDFCSIDIDLWYRFSNFVYNSWHHCRKGMRPSTRDLFAKRACILMFWCPNNVTSLGPTHACKCNMSYVIKQVNKRSIKHRLINKFLGKINKSARISSTLRGGVSSPSAF